MKRNPPSQISISVDFFKSNAMSTPNVLIIGCGVAGPVIALLLQKRGYEPIVFEKVRELGDAGASLMMFPNG
jgi:salicylate hydroxylase